MEDTFKVALYIRVSTERQANEGDSLEEQETELKKFCDYRNYQIHNIYIERGKSGGNTNRPEYQKLIKDVEKKKINAIVVKKLDRLSRSLLDFENLMKLMQQKDVEFISLKENFDTTNAMGKAMLRVALVFAQLEREQTSERIVDVMHHRASQGLFNGGRRIYGYS
ncbi:MAG: recombinase family protein, partial [Candidatus Pacebacteria bacterium]|nr:recombinase family protein [Candidatus Paceibacterota bacterium]